MKYSMVLACATSLALGCGDAKTGSHIGNPVSIGFTVSKALSGSEAPELRDDTNTVYRLIEASTVIRDVQLALPAGITCEDIAENAIVNATCDSQSITTSGPFVVDLLGDGNLKDVRIPDLTYNRLDYRISKAMAGEAGLEANAPLTRNSLVAKAESDGPLGPQTVDLLFDFDSVFTVEAQNGVTANGRLVVSYDTTQWLAGTRVSECIEYDLFEPDEAGHIDPDDDCGAENGDLNGAVQANFDESAQLDNDD